VLDNALEADSFVFEKNGSRVDVSGENLALELAAGGTRILRLEDADFAFRFSTDGIAGAARNAAVTGPDLDGIGVSGQVALLVNTTATPATLPVGSEMIDVPAAPVEDPGDGSAVVQSFVRVEVTGVNPGEPAVLGVAGASLSAEKLTFERTVSGSEQVVRVEASTLSLDLGDGTDRFVSVTVDSAGLLIDGAGIAAEIHEAEIAVHVGDAIGFSGSVNVLIDTRSSAAQFVRVEVTGTDDDGDGRIDRPATLAVAGQSVSGFVEVTDGQGLLLLNSLGVAGEFSVSAEFELPGVALSADTIRLAINTTEVAVEESMALAGDAIELALPAGPFVRVTVLGAELDVAGTVLVGDFSFEQSGPAGPGDRFRTR